MLQYCLVEVERQAAFFCHWEHCTGSAPCQWIPVQAETILVKRLAWSVSGFPGCIAQSVPLLEL